MSTVSTVIVKAPAGIYQGLSHDGVNFFHSIDFLDLPTRFAPAQPAEFAPEQLFDATVERPHEIALSISTPDDASPGSDHPVVVYIHGGRFESGTHEDPRAEGTANARHGVVQVQLGYRVGFEGFVQFPGDEPHAYRGIDDCQVGLEWVQKNIEAFGGDPTNVTIIGQSAGATTALWLMRKDHYRGGFRRVIAISPCYPRHSFAQRKGTLRAFIGKPITRRSFEKASPKRLKRTFKLFRTRYILDMALGPAPFQPEELADVPVLLASTRDEFYHDIGGKWADNLKDSFFKRWIIKKTSILMGLRKESYDLWKFAADKIDPTRTMGRSIGDTQIRRWVAWAGDAAPGDTWMLEFTKTTKPALHCDELRYLFGVHTVDVRDEKKAETARILNNWVQSFIRTGKPEGLPQYRAQSEEDRRTVMVYNLETGEQTIEKGTLDYLYPAYPMNLEEMGF
ncbi:carboxylesterase family protein [Corynebacterium stationis]|uniref:carboxylesterase family protein n=1 Tax=Corynebacterium stationis TaxID=1705 RepID=UPI00273C2EF6|nr:carboxylesterase family protein [Corynebacterium stationis]WLP87162.1 carboxylesterase family protein [Corynebacterium stationis]